MKPLMRLISMCLYDLGSIFGLLYLKYDKFFLYKSHSWCMMLSYEINKKFKLDCWK